MDVAILGGTGAEGFGLALRLAQAGHHVTIGSRVAEKAAASVQEAKTSLGLDASVDGDVNAGSVVGKPVVFVTVPFAGQAMVYDTIKDALVMGDDADAKAVVGSLIADIPGMRWVDCGGLQMARIAEGLTPLLISINGRYKVRESGFRLTGRDVWGDPRG